MRVLDSHSHAWAKWPYSRNVPDPDQRGSAEALLYEMDTHGVEHAVVVCARIGGGAGGDGWPNPSNNAYVTNYANKHPDRLTAWIDVDSSWRPEYHTAGSVARLTTALDTHRATGFTHYFGTQNDGWLQSEEATHFFNAAAARGAIASLSVGAEWLDDLSVIVENNPDLTVLLHHLGGPRRGRQDDIERVVAFAKHPNVGIKVSGFHYLSARPWGFPYADTTTSARQIVDAYGPHRLYWGSDFPASRDLLTYTQSIEVVCTNLDFLPDADLKQVFGENLRRLLATSPA